MYAPLILIQVNWLKSCIKLISFSLAQFERCIEVIER